MNKIYVPTNYVSIINKMKSKMQKAHELMHEAIILSEENYLPFYTERAREDADGNAIPGYYIPDNLRQFTQSPNTNEDRIAHALDLFQKTSVNRKDLLDVMNCIKRGGWRL